MQLICLCLQLYDFICSYITLYAVICSYMQLYAVICSYMQKQYVCREGGMTAMNRFIPGIICI